MKRKKTGSIAIPFLITFLISLVVIGGIAMVIYDKIDGDESSLAPMVKKEAEALSDDNNHTVMFVLDMTDTIDMSQNEENKRPNADDYPDENYEEGGEDEEWGYTAEEEPYTYQPYTFMIMRSRPIDKKLTFLGIPCDMLIGKNNRQAEDIYIDNGVSALKSSLEFTLGIDIERYMVFDTKSFTKVCNIMGGVTFPVPKDVQGVTATAEDDRATTAVYLSAEDIEAIISCGSYTGGEQQRISTAASIISSMAYQITESPVTISRIVGNMDSSFNTVIDMVDSDISALDYSNKKKAIKFMLENSNPKYEVNSSGSVVDTTAPVLTDLPVSWVNFITPSGTVSSSGFTADRYFADDIKPIFGESDKGADESVTVNTTKETAKNTES